MCVHSVCGNNKVNSAHRQREWGERETELGDKVGRTKRTLTGRTRVEAMALSQRQRFISKRRRKENSERRENREKGERRETSETTQRECGCHLRQTYVSLQIERATATTTTTADSASLHFALLITAGC